MERRQSRAGRVNWGKLMAVRVHHTWKGGGSRLGWKEFRSPGSSGKAVAGRQGAPELLPPSPALGRSGPAPGHPPRPATR